VGDVESDGLTSLLFVYVCDTDVTSGFAGESTSKLDSLDSRIRIRIRQIEYGLSHLRPRIKKEAGKCHQLAGVVRRPPTYWMCAAWTTPMSTDCYTTGANSALAPAVERISVHTHTPTQRGASTTWFIHHHRHSQRPRAAACVCVCVCGV